MVVNACAPVLRASAGRPQRFRAPSAARCALNGANTGRIVTAAGISAGIDMSLHLVERLAGRELALATAHRMEYDWNEGA